MQNGEWNGDRGRQVWAYSPHYGRRSYVGKCTITNVVTFAQHFYERGEYACAPPNAHPYWCRVFCTRLIRSRPNMVAVRTYQLRSTRRYGMGGWCTGHHSSDHRPGSQFSRYIERRYQVSSSFQHDVTLRMLYSRSNSASKLTTT